MTENRRRASLAAEVQNWRSRIHAVGGVVVAGTGLGVAAATFAASASFAFASASALALASAFTGCALSWWLFTQPDAVQQLSYNWLSFGPDFTVPISFTIDKLSKVMLLVVTSISALVFTYSLGYMREEEGYSRFFGGLSLFLFSMLGIVLASNFVMMFIFWELVGVSSYLLIGFWYEKASAADAAKKAFMSRCRMTRGQPFMTRPAAPRGSRWPP